MHISGAEWGMQNLLYCCTSILHCAIMYCFVSLSCTVPINCTTIKYMAHCRARMYCSEVCCASRVRYITVAHSCRPICHILYCTVVFAHLSLLTQSTHFPPRLHCSTSLYCIIQYTVLQCSVCMHHHTIPYTVLQCRVCMPELSSYTLKHTSHRTSPSMHPSYSHSNMQCKDPSLLPAHLGSLRDLRGCYALHDLRC